MNTRNLPFEQELLNILKNDGKAAYNAARSGALQAIKDAPGFQLVVGLLRDLEHRTIQNLENGSLNDSQVFRLLGRIEGIKVIRETLRSILPALQQSDIDWYDDDDGAFIPSE
jgi:hypothetical protein